MFNLSENFTLPKLGDINWSELPPNFMEMFTHIWVQAFGSWFFAIIFGVIGAALYIKYDNAVVPVVWFILMTILFGNVLSASMPGIGSAEVVTVLVGVIASFVVGFLLYQLFISKEE